MAKIESALLNVSYLDILSYQDTPVHRLDPRGKLFVTLVFIISVISFNKYEISGLIPFIIYPTILMSMGNVPVAYIFRQVLLAAPFAVFIGVFNPFMDRGIILQLGSFGISGGWVSFASIMIRFLLTATAAVVLIAVSGFNSVCMALEKMGAPKVFAVQLLFLYRYIFVLGDEAARMTRARSLRAFGNRGMGSSAFASMIGHLLLRTLDRAKRIHMAMRCRGFEGTIRVIRPMKIGGRDISFLVGWCLLFVFMRLYNIPQWLGNLVAELMK